MSALIDIPFPEDCNHCLICSLVPELPKRELREKGIQYRLYCKATGECVNEVGRGKDCPLHECKISGVPSAQQDLCEYCHEDSDGYVTPIEKNCHAFICFGMDGWELSLKANGWNGSAKIKYCPMCGRRLKND